jgi:hypothetical protein
MHGTVARHSKIRTDIGERIADLRDSLALARECLARSVEEKASERVLKELRARVIALLDQIDKLQMLECRRM